MRRFVYALLALTIASAAAAQDCTRQAALACPSRTVAGALTSADCVASDSSDFDLWQFTGTAGDAITIDMKSTAFDPYVILLDPNDVPVAENDDVAAGSTDARITFTLTSTGTWTVVANSIAASQGGDYTLSISCPITTLPVRRRSVGT